jgi:carbonic anhydrase
MDARIDPASAFGISLGDAHVIRNAGGNVEDALRSLVISQLLLGTLEILVIKHTGCGMLTFSNSVARSILGENRGEEAVQAAEQAFGSDFQPFVDLEEAVKVDVALLKDSPLIVEGVVVTGWIYDVQTAKVTQVV